MNPITWALSLEPETQIVVGLIMMLCGGMMLWPYGGQLDRYAKTHPGFAKVWYWPSRKPW